MCVCVLYLYTFILDPMVKVKFILTVWFCSCMQIALADDTLSIYLCTVDILYFYLQFDEQYGDFEESKKYVRDDGEGKSRWK